MGDADEVGDDAPTRSELCDDVTVPNERRASIPKPSSGPKLTGHPPAEGERYADEGKLGAGAMGTVHLCHDGLIGRRVARKAMHPHQRTDPWLRRRFEHEARIQGQLEHPAIVPVYDVTVGPDGIEYFTMRRVEGSSLFRILQQLRERAPEARQRYGLRRLLSAFATVCLAIAYAHKRGIVHRDIKPSNVMLGDYGEVYVLDWGIARVLGEDESSGDRRSPSILIPAVEGDPLATGVGDLIGTLGYMSPEQARGEPAGPAADVYALAATLFEILTLQRLHSLDSPTALRELRVGVEARPSRRAPAQRVAQELEDLCVRATSLAPAARPDAQTMHDSIQEFLDGQRDHERRAQLAGRYIALANEELGMVLAGGPGAREARERALAAINRAHALGVDDARATEVLQMLVHAPIDVSGQVDAALVSTTIATRRNAMRGAALLVCVWLVGTASVACLGVRSWLCLALEMMLLAFGGALTLMNAHRERPAAVWAFLAVANIAALSVSVAFSWFVLVPGLLSFIAVGYTIVNRPTAWYREHQPVMRFMRPTMLLTGPAGIVLLVALEAVGILPPSVAFRDGSIVILPRVVDFPEKGTILFLALANIVLIVGPAVHVLRLRDAMYTMERRAFAVAARLRELVPAEARRATPTMTPLQDELQVEK